MAKEIEIFICQNCGEDFPKWQGRCPNCGEWNSLVKSKIPKITRSENQVKISQPEKFSQIETSGKNKILTKISELDRVLGGGIISGSVILFAGDPGIGKSTLMLQFAKGVKKILYVSGEESAAQIKMRAVRLGLDKNQEISILTTNNLDSIAAAVNSQKYNLVIIDSIQTIQDLETSGTPGSVAQVKILGLKLQKIAKEKNLPIILTSHVTKEGVVAGPKTLEHIVDCVIYLEGERYGQFRILRAIKNRFGSVNEVGVFEMTKAGLEEVKNPSGIFLENRQTNIPGVAISCIVEGTRPLLVEIQALTNPSSFGFPKRTSSGISLNRLFLLIAILSSRGKINLTNLDVYLNIAGGLKIFETSVDLACLASIASVVKNLLVDPEMVIIGEVGLSGEIRQVPQIEPRILEAQKIGFKKVIIPRMKLSKNFQIKIFKISNLQQALDLVLLK